LACLLTDADRKERIARIQQSIAELSALTNDKKVTSASYQTYRHARASIDHYQNHHQAHFCPQVVGQAVAFVVALHSQDLPSGRQAHG
jgi:hypothetical protein